MARAKSKSKSKDSEHELEVNAKWTGPEFWKEWGKDKKNKGGSTSGAGALYFLGFIGAAVYYIQAAEGVGDGIFGIIKALFWPGIVVYKLIESFYGIA